MLDNALIKLIIATLIAQEATAGIPGTPIKQAFQPTQQGVNTAPTAYLHKLGDRRIGSPFRSDVWDEINEVEIHTELQQYETDFQISALATQDPATPTQYTASDILNLIAYSLQSEYMITTLQAQGVGILRVRDVRNPYFKDDRARNEASPNLDFTVTHKQIVTSQVPVLQSTEFNILVV